MSSPQPPAGMPRLRVMLADDHDVVRRGLRSLVDAESDLEVVAEAASVAEAVRLARQAQPNVVVMDVRFPDGSGVEAVREIRSQNRQIRALMLTSFTDENAVMAAILAGASGYLLKEINGAEILSGIRAVGAGRSLLDPTVTIGVLDKLRNGEGPTLDAKLARLTGQEERVLYLIAEGDTNAEIATELGLSDKTVKNYVSSILGKLQVRRRAEAAAYLARRSR
jgi:two-component system response regulator DevR